MLNAERPVQNVEVGKTSLLGQQAYLSQDPWSNLSALVSCILALASCILLLKQKSYVQNNHFHP
jgi:hypothetical protein